MSFDDLFELNKDISKVKVALNIEGKEYKKGEVIAETKFKDFDLMDAPKEHYYMVTRLNDGFFLNGKADKT